MENNFTAKTVDEMSNEELTRWLCLYEAVDLITVNASKNKIDLNNTNDWIKPLSFKMYIKETYFSTLDKVCYHRNEIPDFSKDAYCVVDVLEQKNVNKDINDEHNDDIIDSLDTIDTL